MRIAAPALGFLAEGFKQVFSASRGKTLLFAPLTRTKLTSLIDVPTSAGSPREGNVGTVRRGKSNGRPLDEDTQYGIRQFSARSSNQKHES
jgi:hypothetical protein